MAAAIDGGSGSTDEEEGGGNTVFDGISLTFSADSASTVEAFEGSLRLTMVQEISIKTPD